MRLALLLAALVSGGSLAATAGTHRMSLAVEGARSGGRIPAAMAFCVTAPRGHITYGANISPAIRWTAPPVGTRSLAILMTDDDVPADTSNVNADGKRIAASAPRRRFYHWVVADLPPGTRYLAAGVGGSGVVPHGRTRSAGPGRAAVNDYTGFFAQDAAMSGTFTGYDGPCPPWNDERVHRYEILVMALDVSHLALPDEYTGPQFERAARGHLLGSASVSLTCKRWSTWSKAAISSRRCRGGSPSPMPARPTSRCGTATSEARS